MSPIEQIAAADEDERVIACFQVAEKNLPYLPYLRPSFCRFCPLSSGWLVGWLALFVLLSSLFFFLLAKSKKEKACKYMYVCVYTHTF